MFAIKAPRLPEDELRRRAELFLREHHPEMSVPVPIERIIETSLGMDIVPIGGLHTLIGKDGWITPDGSAIYVDQHFYLKVENRYRFTLAHEVAHLVLHGDILRQIKFESLEEYKSSMSSLDPASLSVVEWQANAFAGLILVPPDPLEAAFESLANRAIDSGVDIHELSSHQRRSFDEAIAKTFGVSRQVITIRLERDGHVRRT